MRFKPSSIPTPLRTIQMEYNSDADLSQLELDMLDKYMELHKELFVIFRDWKAIKEDYKALEKPLENIKQQLIALNEEIKQYRQLAGFTQEEVDQMPDPGELELDPGELVQHGKQLEALFEPLYEKVQQLSQRFHDMQQHVNRLEEQYEEFDDNYFLPIIKGYEAMEIDIIRLDEDFNELNILMDNLDGLMSATLDERNAMVTSYNAMVKDMDIAFGRIDRVSAEVNIPENGAGENPELN